MSNLQYHHDNEHVARAQAHTVLATCSPSILRQLHGFLLKTDLKNQVQTPAQIARHNAGYSALIRWVKTLFTLDVLKPWASSETVNVAILSVNFLKRCGQLDDIYTCNKSKRIDLRQQ